MKSGDPASRRRIETQILHFDGIDWMPYSYQWNEEQTDALLVSAAGNERALDIADPAAAGGKRKQTWRFAGRAECQRCHNKWSGPPIAFNTPQLNKSHPYGSSSISQLDALAEMKLLEKPIVLDPKAPKLASPHDTTASQSDRARAYLHTNCAHCHRENAGSAVLSKMYFDLPLEKTNMVGVRPTQGTFSIHAAQVISPGDPFRSVLLYRMSKLGGGRMPHIGSSEVDAQGIQLIHNWIKELPPESAADKTGNEVAARLRQEETADLNLLKKTSATKDAEIVERLLSSTSGAMMLERAVARSEVGGPMAALAVDKAAAHTDVSIRDLFERYLTPEKRLKRLGSVIQPQQILALTGDVSRGKKVFFENAAVSCKNCHRIGTEGKQIGPELTTIGKKLSRARILESILEPSKLIEPKYVTYLAELDDGRLVTGILLKKDESEVVLKDAQDKEVRIPAKEVERLVPLTQSLMPDLQLRDMTAEQVADLLAYLSSLK
jgi:putative heme-binding domain-containing protein